MPRRSVIPLVALALAGCTAETPPASEPAISPSETRPPLGRITSRDVPPFPNPTRAELDDGTPVVLDPRTRELRVGDETIHAGVGPTHVTVGAGGRIYVTDTGGDGVLYFRTQPHLALVRRVAVPGRPYASALDRMRGPLWVTLTETNELVKIPADGLPRITATFPTIRQPDAVTFDALTGDVYVRGADGRVLVLPADLHSPDR